MCDVRHAATAPVTRRRWTPPPPPGASPLPTPSRDDATPSSPSPSAPSLRWQTQQPLTAQPPPTSSVDLVFLCRSLNPQHRPTTTSVPVTARALPPRRQQREVAGGRKYGGSLSHSALRMRVCGSQCRAVRWLPARPSSVFLRGLAPPLAVLSFPSPYNLVSRTPGPGHN